MAGYAGTPLATKLGLREGQRFVVLHEPAEFQAALGETPSAVERGSSLAGKHPIDVAVLFVRTRTVLEREFAAVAHALDPAGGLWIAWPKKSSRVPTDVTEDVLRTVLLPSGLVDDKVCAIDATWSGLRFVGRVELRAARASELGIASAKSAVRRGTATPARGSNAAPRPRKKLGRKN